MSVRKIGLESCLDRTLITGEFSEFPTLFKQAIQPYTELFLDEMGCDLADARPDFNTGVNEWGASVLWGIGLIELIS